MTSTSRRRLGIGGPIVMAALLLGHGLACEEADSVPVRKPSLAVRTVKFAGMPDGPPAVMFGSTPATVTTNGNFDDPGAKFRIRGGKLTVAPTQPDRSASYLSSPNLGAPIINIGARWTFTKRLGTRHGAMALVVSDEVLDLPFPVHLSVSAFSWGFGVWAPKENGKIPPLDVLERGNFDPPLREDGVTVHEAEIWVDGDRAEIRLPDDSRHLVRDQRIAEWEGRHATFEAWAANGLTDSTVAFAEIWAGTREDRAEGTRVPR